MFHIDIFFTRPFRQKAVLHQQYQVPKVVIPKNRCSTTFSDVTILNFEAYRLYSMEFRTEDCNQLKKLI